MKTMESESWVGSLSKNGLQSGSETTKNNKTQELWLQNALILSCALGLHL